MDAPSPYISSNLVFDLRPEFLESVKPAFCVLLSINGFMKCAVVYNEIRQETCNRIRPSRAITFSSLQKSTQCGIISPHKSLLLEFFVLISLNVTHKPEYSIFFSNSIEILTNVLPRTLVRGILFI